MEYYQQTKIDQFYKVVSNKNTGCGIITKKRNSARNLFKGRRKTLSNISGSPYVKSDVEIFKDFGNKAKMASQKRFSQNELNSLSKKQKTNSFTADNTDDATFDMPLSQISTNSQNTQNPQSPDKPYYKNRINVDTLKSAIDNLNLVRQGSIKPNELDLEKIFLSNDFDMFYHDFEEMDIKIFKESEIIYPLDYNADQLIIIVSEVFSNPLNCGYFTKDELNFIFSLFTLSMESQKLFTRLLKRKLSWHRTSSLKYPEVSDNLDPFLQELVHHGFLTSDLKDLDISELFDKLYADEVKKICQSLKIPHQGKKENLKLKLLNYGKKKTTMFLGAKTPEIILRETITKVVKNCVCLKSDVIEIYDRIFMLLNPVQDPEETLSEFLFRLSNVQRGEICYPNFKIKIFPIFQDRLHLMKYTESKNVLRSIYDAIEKKNWDEVRSIGTKALENVLKNNYSVKNNLPSHIKKFNPRYMWIKTLTKSIDAFKKTKETIDIAVNILEFLIKDAQSSKVKWCNELALIEMHHKKDLEKSAKLILDLLETDEMSILNVWDCEDRLQKLLRRKTGISDETKNLIEKAQEKLKSKYPVPDFFYSNTILASMANKADPKGKTIWCFNDSEGNKSFGSVEMVAIQHYTSEENFLKGLHCEGSLPVSLFMLLFWTELYEVDVPGAFVTPYQLAPLDLFTANFYDNRKDEIENKLKFVENMDLETFGDWMSDNYLQYCKYYSLMSGSLFADDKQVKEIVTCLGINGVIGLCKKLISNYPCWQSGFPDLIVWNAQLLKCKIVEVKGPSDSLSIKQKLWIQHLSKVGLDVEVCLVEASGSDSK